MADKETRIRITAVDDTTRTLNSIRSATKDLTGDFGKLGGALSALGVGAAVFGLAAMVKSAISAAAAMDDLSQKTGIQVKHLTALDYAMRREGVSTEAFAKGMQQLSKSMVEAGDASSKTGRLFKTLGIDAGTGPREAMLKLADAFKTLPDGATKSALAMALLGKAGTDLIPALNHGAAGLRNLEEEAHRLGVTFGSDTAKAAADFEDKLFALEASSKSLGITLAKDLLQPLNRIAGAMRDAAIEGGLLHAAFIGLGGVFSEALGLNAEGEQRIRQIREELARINKEIREAGLAGDIVQQAVIDRHQERIKQLETELKLIEQANKARKPPEFVGPPSPSQAELDRRLRADLASKAGAAVADPARNLLIALQLEYTKLNNVTKQNETLERVLSEFKKDAYAKASKGLKDQAIEQAKLIDQKKQELLSEKAALDSRVAAAKEANEEFDRALQLEEERQKFTENSIRSIREYGDELEFEATLMGLSNAERAKSIALHRLEKVGIDATAESVQELVNRIRDQVQLQEELRNQANLWEDIASRGAEFFSDLATRGADAFKSLKASLKDLLREMIAIFAKRWILQLAAGATGNSALSVMAGQVGQGTMGGAANSLLGTGLSIAGNWAAGAAGFTGLGTLGGFTGALTGAIPAGAIGSGAVAAGVGVNTAATGLGSALSGVYSALAAIPVWGWIAMAVVAIGAWIAGNHKGGPKVGGSFMGSFDSEGDFAGNLAVPGSDNGRFFTPNQADSQVRQIVEGTSRGFHDALTRFGGTTAGIGFGLGFDHDPAGTAQSRVSSMVTDASGRVIYRQQDLEMDDKEVPAALQLEAQRMILAALQASNLPEGVAEIINSVTDIGAATAEQITAVLNLATAYQDLGRVIEALEGGPLTALTQQLDAMKSRVEAAQGAFDDAIAGGDAAEILAAEQELAAAIMDRYNNELQMVRSLQAAIRSIEQEAYQFSLNMAGRINAVGGSRDIASIAMGRATTLRGRVGGNAPTSQQLEDVGGYVGAIDTWYNARRDAITRDAEAQAAAANAISQAQARAAQARVMALEKELDLARAFQGVIDRAKQIVSDMRLSSMNPASVTGRLSLAGDDVSRARAVFQGSTGSDKVDAANRLLDALIRQRDLGMEAFQRPSQEWQDLYNSIVSEISAIEGEAKPEAERALELQQAILVEQQRANSYASVTADASQFAAAAMQALDAEARGYYEWAETEGMRLFGIERGEQEALLNAITGGMEPNLYIAQLTGEVVEELRGLRADIREGLAAPNVTVNVQVDGDGEVTTETIVDGVRRAAPTIKRILATA